MRLCQFSLCEDVATVWWRGEAFCGAHALKRWGKRDVVLAARFSEIHRSLQASEPKGLPSPARTGGASSEAPSSGRASVGGSLPASEPGPSLEDELADILEREGWNEWAGW